MSEELETKQPGVVIDSIASGGKYHLTTGAVEKTYTMDEYIGVIKGLWENYIAQGKEPSLVGVPITDLALVHETLHCIAPNSFYASDGWKLPENREQFAYWLLSEENMAGIRRRIDGDDFESLVTNLEDILRLNLERKR